MKNLGMNTMCDLVNLILEKTKELDKFAMVAWAEWQRQNKLQSKEDSTPIHKLFTKFKDIKLNISNNKGQKKKKKNLFNNL